MSSVFFIHVRVSPAAGPSETKSDSGTLRLASNTPIYFFLCWVNLTSITPSWWYKVAFGMFFYSRDTLPVKEIHYTSALITRPLIQWFLLRSSIQLYQSPSKTRRYAEELWLFVSHNFSVLLCNPPTESASRRTRRQQSSA